MSTPITPLPPGIVAIPTNRPPFGSGQKNSYFTNILISPGYVQPPVPVTASPAPPRVHPCQVDTGSCGLVVPEFLFYVDGQVGGTLLPGVKKSGPATILYQPSKNDLQGSYYQVAEVGIGVDANGNCAAICKNVTVVGVANVQAYEGMLGVGFGRPNQYGDNLFLSASGVYPSFLLTKSGIWLGFTQSTLPGSGWGFQQLQRSSPSPIAVPGWSTPAVSLSVGSAIVQGSALLDTGVGLMMMGLDLVGWDSSLPNQQVTISWPNTGNSANILSYSFTLGPAISVPVDQVATPSYAPGYSVQGNLPMSPDSFLTLGAKSPSFVNTGINVIAGANFFFDSQVGQVGFLSLGDT
jgi:hypothetical protein